ncbi:hypothetical protein [Streptomyces sp. NPDC046985]|uniref:hypothetical protein n=1 Tax=Streptomyces sp. NPDC046985 TaxID=3155377 RepID=UPI0033FFB765
MIVHRPEKPDVRRAETGWATARRVRRNGVRTCLPAIDATGPRRERGGPENGADWNIVRGED